MKNEPDLRVLRLSLNLTQKEMATLLRMHVSNYADMERDGPKQNGWKVAVAAMSKLHRHRQLMRFLQEYYEGNE